MDKSQKKQYQASNLLTVNQGALEVTIIPVVNQTDWIVPKVLILDEVGCNSHLTSYQWQDHNIAVYDLTSSKVKPDSIIILEGTSDKNRLGLLIKGSLKDHYIKISDIKDIESNDDASKEDTGSFVFQEVLVEQQSYIVPDLEGLINRLTIDKSEK